MRRAVLFLSLTALAGCAGAADHPAAIEGGIEETSIVTIDPCAPAVEGCPCVVPGETAACTAVRESGSYRSCEPGVLTCQDNGHYGPCVGPSNWKN